MLDKQQYENELQQIIDSNESKVAALVLSSLISEYGMQAATKFTLKNAVKSLSSLMNKPKFSNGLEQTMTSAVIAAMSLLKQNKFTTTSLYDQAKQQTIKTVKRASDYYDSKFPNDTKYANSDFERSALISARWMIRNAVFDAQSSVAASFNMTHKTWISRGDNRVRHSHSVLDGKSVPINSSFKLPNGGTIMFPGDYNAPLEETVNCRCIIIFE